MKRFSYGLICLFLAVITGCDKEPEPDSNLPDYFSIPSRLEGYEGSGQIVIEGDINLSVQGPERKQSDNTYSGVLASGSVNDDFTFEGTINQPLPYSQSSRVPNAYISNLNLFNNNIFKVGSYPMGTRMQPSPRGEISDIVLNLPGPAIYSAQEGSFTIDEVSLIRQEGTYLLYRVRGSLDAMLFGSGPRVKKQEPHITGTFDLLFVAQ